MADLWTCPSCRRRFANVSQWHSCLHMALDEHLANKTDHAIGIYRSVHMAVAACGAFRIHPQKTRIAFIARMTFAGVHLAQRWVDLSMILPGPLGDMRVRTIELYGPTTFAHVVRLSAPEEIDDDVRRWLCEALARGEQQTSDPHTDVEAVVGPALERLTAPFRGRVVARHGTLALAVPRYVAQAFGAHPQVVVRIRGEHHSGEIQSGENGPRLTADDALEQAGLGAGDEVDISVRAHL